MENEEWRIIKWVPGYEISNLGRVRSFKNGKKGQKKKPKLLRVCEQQNGYKLVCLSHGDKRLTAYVHRLIADAFIDNNDEEKIEVNHIDRNHSNNIVSNLEWTTPLENAVHKRISRAFKRNLGLAPRWDKLLVKIAKLPVQEQDCLFHHINNMKIS